MLELNPQTGSAPEQPVFDMNGDGALTAGDGVTLADNKLALVTGLYLGKGVGSQTVFVNQSASRRIAYTNRNLLDATDAPCVANCDGALQDGENDVSNNDDSGTIAPWPITAVSPCGNQACIVETRPNLGRMTWKELFAD